MKSQKRKQVVDFYEEESKIYDKRRFLTSEGKYIDRVQKELVLSMVDSWENKTILDLGCGTGRFSIELAQQGAVVTGLDPAKEMLDETYKKVEDASSIGAIQLIKGNAYNLPFKSDTFDSCICISVLNHLRSWDKVFNEIHRVVKQNGFFIMSFTNLISLYFPAALWVNLTKRSIFDDVYSRWDLLPRVKKELRRAGFNPTKIAGITNPPPLPSPLAIFLLKKSTHLSSNPFIKRVSSTVFIYNQVI